MKSPLLAGVTALTFVALTVTTLYAQVVGGTSIIDKMKAVSHAFILSSQLNPSDTGLTSEPLKGKKTGDILTAGEYNRMLEVIANAGGGISDVEVVTSTNVGSAAGTSYANRWSEAICPTGKQVISGGCSYPNTLNSFIHNAPKVDLTGWACGGIGFNGDISATSTQYPTRPTAYAVCGTYGSGGGSGGGTSFYKCTNAQSLDSTNAPCYGASRNRGAGDGRYRALTGVHVANNLNFTNAILSFFDDKWKCSQTGVGHYDCTDGTVLVADTQGSGGGASSTCPSGFVAVGSFCIEPTMGPTGKDWYEAANACADKGAQLCHWSEWAVACSKGKLTDIVLGAGGKYEWIDDYSVAAQGVADPIVHSDCRYLSRQADTTKAANTSYRCCASQK